MMIGMVVITPKMAGGKGDEGCKKVKASEYMAMVLPKAGGSVNQVSCVTSCVGKSEMGGKALKCSSP